LHSHIPSETGHNPDRYFDSITDQGSFVEHLATVNHRNQALGLGQPQIRQLIGFPSPALLLEHIRWQHYDVVKPSEGVVHSQANGPFEDRGLVVP